MLSALEKQIKEENKELTSLAYKKGRLDEEKQRWQEINVDIGVIHDEITDLNPKLSSIPKVTDAVSNSLFLVGFFWNGADRLL